MSALTLPGDIPGLLRRGSPVVIEEWRGNITSEKPDDDGEYRVCGTDNDRRNGWWRTGLALDLTDATGRAHAAWWPAKDRDPEDGSVTWANCADHRTCERTRSWMFHNDGEDFCRYGDDWCPYLAHLDPGDPRRLDDGSRWVDAEALRLVVLHVAGRS